MRDTVNIEAYIDEKPVGNLQKAAIALCALVAMLDGFDTQAIAFVAPILSKAWNVPVTAFGAVFGAGLLGLAIGSLIMGPLADKWGRKAVIVLASVLFGLFSLATAFANDMPTLLALRFLTGLGLGGAVPNLISLTSEYSPKSSRTFLTTLMWTGFPLGAVIGGLASAKLIPAYGWQSVFILGGILPLVAVPCLMLWLPESIRYLVTQPQKKKVLDRLLSKLVPDSHANTQIITSEQDKGSPTPVKDVFAQGRAPGTLLLWSVFFSNLLILYFLINWLPYVLRQAGFPIEKAIIGTVILNASGILGGLLMGKLVDKFGAYKILPPAYALTAIAVAAIGYAPASVAASIVAIAFAGFFVIGTQFCMNALAASYYPTSSRASGVGLAFGVGRIGSVVGPVIGGFILANNWSMAATFTVTAIPAILSAIAVWLIGRLKNRTNL